VRWPFLVAASPLLDYRTVAAPSFLTSADAARQLARLVGGDADAGVRRAELNIGGRRYFVTYRARIAVAEEVGLSSAAGLLRDRQGRALLLFEGIIGNSDMEVIDWLSVSAAVSPAYCEFWRERNVWAVRATEPLENAAVRRPEPEGPAEPPNAGKAEPRTVIGGVDREGEHEAGVAPATIPARGKGQTRGRNRSVALWVAIGVAGGVALADRIIRWTSHPEDLSNRRLLLADLGMGLLTVGIAVAVLFFSAMLAERDRPTSP
jgi:hypothetical protein